MAIKNPCVPKYEGFHQHEELHINYRIPFGFSVKVVSVSLSRKVRVASKLYFEFESFVIQVLAPIATEFM